MMRWKSFVFLAMVGLLASGCSSDGGSLLDVFGKGALNTETIVAGLKQALEVGTNNAVKATSRTGGYWDNLAIRILMPEKLKSVASTLRKVGLGAQVDAFERKMNEAAESAAAHAAPIFVNAIKDMTFADAKGILSGGNTAATDYFRAKTSEGLTSLYLPIVKSKMRELGVMKAYDDLLARYLRLPLAPKPTVSIEQYVTDKGLAGLFNVLGKEERLIRENPAARTTELLRRVFGD